MEVDRRSLKPDPDSTLDLKTPEWLQAVLSCLEDDSRRVRTAALEALQTARVDLRPCQDFLSARLVAEPRPEIAALLVDVLRSHDLFSEQTIRTIAGTRPYHWTDEQFQRSVSQYLSAGMQSTNSVEALSQLYRSAILGIPFNQKSGAQVASDLLDLALRHPDLQEGFDVSLAYLLGAEVSKSEKSALAKKILTALPELHGWQRSLLAPVLARNFDPYLRPLREWRYALEAISPVDATRASLNINAIQSFPKKACLDDLIEMRNITAPRLEDIERAFFYVVHGRSREVKELAAHVFSGLFERAGSRDALPMLMYFFGEGHSAPIILARVDSMVERINLNETERFHLALSLYFGAFRSGARADDVLDKCQRASAGLEAAANVCGLFHRAVTSELIRGARISVAHSQEVNFRVLLRKQIQVLKGLQREDNPLAPQIDSFVWGTVLTHPMCDDVIRASIETTAASTQPEKAMRVLKHMMLCDSIDSDLFKPWKKAFFDVFMKLPKKERIEAIQFARYTMNEEGRPGKDLVDLRLIHRLFCSVDKIQDQLTCPENMNVPTMLNTLHAIVELASLVEDPTARKRASDMLLEARPLVTPPQQPSTQLLRLLDRSIQVYSIAA